MSGPTSNCKRCGKGFVGGACPYCTVTGVDLESLLNAEEMKLLRDENQTETPVALVDMVSGKPFAVTTPVCKIGRDLGNDIALAGDRSMSRYHCQIRQSGEDFYIEDCGSRNGTFLNGSPIAVPRKLQNGDIVSAGVSRYRFSLQTCSIGRGSDPDAAKAGISPQELNQAREALDKLRGSVDLTPCDSGAITVEQPGNDRTPFAAESPFAGGISSFTEFVETDNGSESPKQQQKEAPKSKQLLDEPALKAVPQFILNELPAPPQWLDEFAFPEIQKLMSEKERLNGLIEEVRQDIKQIDRKIASTQGILQALLSGSGPELGQAAKQVFEILEWQTESAANNPFEINLKKSAKIEAVVKVVLTQGDPSTKDFEALINQQAVIWCQSNYEPKGIMLVQISPELQPRQRGTLSKDFLENMRRKKICIVLPTQLLAIYRQVVLNGQDKNYFKEILLNTCGPLPGLSAKAAESHAATA